MKQSYELKPCPLCGSKVVITTMNADSTLFWDKMILRCNARIECSCGLSFEKEWYEPSGEHLTLINNKNIVDEWNDRIEKIERR